MPGLLLAVAFAAGCSPTLRAPQQGDFAVATAHPAATDAAVRILQQGGNAFDAAVAATATLAVVEPYSSGLGGGGFYLLHRAADGADVMLDARERAPLAATRDMYLAADGQVVPGLSVDGALAAGIPGIPAALDQLASRYGRLPLAQCLEPAIRLAEAGVAVGPTYRRYAALRAEALRDGGAAAIFLDEGESPASGWLLRQPELAATLRRIAAEGSADFYQGALAERLVAGVAARGGIWSLADLRAYRVIEREPLRMRYRDHLIISASPPSSGGVALATMLHILERYDLDRSTELQRGHLIVEAMRRAYRDRAAFLGDPDHVSVPVEELVSARHSDLLAQDIDLLRATDSAMWEALDSGSGGQHTTHFSIIDAEGNRVAATLSINYAFGSGVAVAGTGVLLNNEMDDFAAAPGVANLYGLVGSQANAIAPGKRMLSSMSPTFVEGPRGVAVIGTPGGSRIITMVLLALLEYVNGADAAGVVAAPRFHHQYLPDTLQYEAGSFSDETLDGLAAMGHQLREVASESYGDMQMVSRDRRTGRLDAASDPRGEGESAVCLLERGCVRVGRD